MHLTHGETQAYKHTQLYIYAQHIMQHASHRIINSVKNTFSDNYQLKAIPFNRHRLTTVCVEFRCLGDGVIKCDEAIFYTQNNYTGFKIS